MTIRDVMEMCVESGSMNLSVWDLDANRERYRGPYCFMDEDLKQYEVQSFDPPCMMDVNGMDEIVVVFNV